MSDYEVWVCPVCGRQLTGLPSTLSGPRICARHHPTVHGEKLDVYHLPPEAIERVFTRARELGAPLRDDAHLVAPQESLLFAIAWICGVQVTGPKELPLWAFSPKPQEPQDSLEQPTLFEGASKNGTTARSI